MNIYTKSGDKGKTALVGGSRVQKDDPRVEAYGTVDELISYIAIIRSDVNEIEYSANLRRIQANLMLVAAQLASDENGIKRVKNFDDNETIFLEKQIDEMTSQLPTQVAFILPDRPRVAAECHVARTICRRAERRSISLMRENPLLESGIRYLNRLSDYLFTYGRFLSMKNDIPDDFWYQ